MMGETARRIEGDLVDAQSPRPPLLFTPLALRGVTARNRIVVSPMSQYCSVEGEPTDWHLVHLGKFAMGGAGIVFVEETAVEERARKTYGCPGIYTDGQARAWRRITDFLRSQGALSAIQLGHAGRKVATKAPWEGFAPLTEEDARHGRPPWRGYAPSPIPFRPGALVPIEMDEADIRQVIAAHVAARHLFGLDDRTSGSEIGIQEMGLYRMQDGIAIRTIYGCAESGVERNGMAAAIHDKIRNVGLALHFDLLEDPAKLSRRRQSSANTFEYSEISIIEYVGSIERCLAGIFCGPWAEVSLGIDFPGRSVIGELRHKRCGTI